jgi:hypothetical protein
MVRSHRDPLRVFADLRLPADSFCPGHMPAHEAQCSAVGNMLMSAPISAKMAWAVILPTNQRASVAVVAAHATAPDDVRRRSVCVPCPSRAQEGLGPTAT